MNAVELSVLLLPSVLLPLLVCLVAWGAVVLALRQENRTTAALNALLPPAETGRTTTVSRVPAMARLSPSDSQVREPS